MNCPHDFPLSVKDLDSDKVQCRFASAELGECVDCALHSFIELQKVSEVKARKVKPKEKVEGKKWWIFLSS